MDSKYRYLFILRTIAITLILYISTICLYLVYVYKPIELVQGDFQEINDQITKMNQENMIFFLIISLLICFGISIILLFVYEGIILYTKPIISVYATLIEKKANLNISGDHKGYFGVGYTYNMNFETEEGTKLNFQVSPKYYTTIIEGNSGILKYKQAAYKKFIDFQLRKID